MSWHYLQALGEEFSAASYLAGIRWQRWNLNATRGSCCCNGSGMEFCRPSLCGTMSAPLTESRGAALSMSFQAASPVRTFQPQGKGQELTEPGAGSGLRCTESFARFDHATRSWKTLQCSLLEDSIEYSGTWPKQGIMRRGWCWALPMWVLRTGGTESGFWQRMPKGETFFHTPNCTGMDGGSNSRKALKRRLEARHMMPTPTACNAPNSGSNTKGPKSLLEVARTGWNPGETWPTPTCQDAKNNGSQSQQNRHSKPLNAVAGGALNPPWVEWLMGWPIGWTDLEPLEMDKFRSWLRLHSENLETFSKKN